MANWKFKYDNAGYRAVRNSAGVQTLVNAAARSQLTQARSMLNAHGYTRNPQFQLTTYTDKYGNKGKCVYTASLYSQRFVSKHGWKVR